MNDQIIRFHSRNEINLNRVVEDQWRKDLFKKHEVNTSKAIHVTMNEKQILIHHLYLLDWFYTILVIYFADMISNLLTSKQSLSYS